jgi:hypothetical protein
MRRLCGWCHDLVMDVVSIVLALATFAVLLVLVEGLDRL